MIISCTSNSYVTFFNILCNITTLYEPITFIKFLIVIIFVTVNLIELVPFSSQIINAASKMLIWLCSLTTFNSTSDEDITETCIISNKGTITFIRLSNYLMKFSYSPYFTVTITSNISLTASRSSSLNQIKWWLSIFPLPSTIVKLAKQNSYISHPYLMINLFAATSGDT